MEPASIGAASGVINLAKGPLGWIKKKLARRKPLHISVEHVIADSWCVTSQLSNLTSEIPADIDPQTIHAALIKEGAADYKETRLRLHLLNKCYDNISIRDIRVVRTAKSEAHYGTFVKYPGGGESRIPFIVYSLDEPRSSIKEEVDYFDTNTVSLSPGEVFNFQMQCKTFHFYCEWHIQVRYRVNGQSKVAEVFNDSEPFRTSGAPANEFISRKIWVWFHSDPARRGLQDEADVHNNWGEN
ncbi:hypothetical protein E1200_17850 [Actinomadura sp. GC306]|uniref:hypothetical protein n=1 Tax=Actinomadura sp. GC306 TaxID=2530367 RepID=UPI0010530660|nr:hypothetical protein [Actinomadura sp. GC306]TDC65794.1 hypothetical protein E1200_17850 [Actinomadura sp. GC306]